jgi:rhodanese-related sulfurtransferase
MERLLEFVANHPLLSGGFVAVLAILVWTEVMRKVQGLVELSPAQAVPWINRKNGVVIDISPTADFDKGHIVDARNIPMSRLTSNDNEIKKLLDKSILVVCKSGQTAVNAAASLKKQGVSDVAVLKGGMTAWLNDQYPVTRKK